MTTVTGRIVHKGGKGSGHYGHAGRPGKRGGSSSSSFAMSIRTGKDAAARQAAASGKQPKPDNSGEMADADIVASVRVGLAKIGSKVNQWNVRDDLMRISNENLYTNWASIDEKTARNILSEIMELDDEDLLDFDENSLMALESYAHK